jgi:hypothetical protein
MGSAGFVVAPADFGVVGVALAREPVGCVIEKFDAPTARIGDRGEVVIPFLNQSEN